MNFSIKINIAYYLESILTRNIKRYRNNLGLLRQLLKRMVKTPTIYERAFSMIISYGIVKIILIYFSK